MLFHFIVPNHDIHLVSLINWKCLTASITIFIEYVFSYLEAKLFVPVNLLIFWIFPNRPHLDKNDIKIDTSTFVQRNVSVKESHFQH